MALHYEYMQLEVQSCLMSHNVNVNLLTGLLDWHKLNQNLQQNTKIHIVKKCVYLSFGTVVYIVYDIGSRLIKDKC